MLSMARTRAEAERINFIGGAAQDSMLMHLFIPLLFQMVLSVGIDLVWLLYNTLQLIGNVWNIDGLVLPGSTRTVIQIVEQVTFFQFLENREVKDWLKEKMQIVDHIVSTLGTSGIVVAGLISSVLFVLILNRFKSSKFITKMKDGLIWSSVIRGIIETYLPQMIKVIRTFNSTGVTTSALMVNVAKITVLIGCPVFGLVYMLKHQ